MINEEFNSLIHAPNRLQICAFLAEVAQAEFLTVADMLDVSDSVLSKHLKTLEEAGYLALKKETIDGRRRTWISLTRSGLTAFNKHIKALKAIIG